MCEKTFKCSTLYELGFNCNIGLLHANEILDRILYAGYGPQGTAFTEMGHALGHVLNSRLYKQC